MSKNITIYTTNTCASCGMVKKYLSSKGQEYQVINLDESPEHIQDLLNLSGQLAVPVTVIKDESGQQDVTVGWNPGKLASALAA